MYHFILLPLFVSLATSQADIYENAVDVGVYEMVHTRNLNCGNIKLPFGCRISPDCTTKTCKISFVGLDFIKKIKINKCDSPVTVSVSLEVPQLNVNFAHTFPTDQIIPIPGLGQGIGPLRGGVFILVKMRSENSHLNVLVQLQAGVAIGNAPIFPIKLDLLKARLPIKTDDCSGGGGGGGGGLPPPPPGGACSDGNNLCGFLASQCGNPAISGLCKKSCNAC